MSSYSAVKRFSSDICAPFTKVDTEKSCEADKDVQHRRIAEIYPVKKDHTITSLIKYL